MSCTAARQARPKGVSPNSFFTLSGASRTSNALSCSDDIILRAAAMLAACSVFSVEVLEPAAGELRPRRRSPGRRAASWPRSSRHAGRHVGNRAAGIERLERVVLIAQKAAAGRPLAGQNRNVPRNLDVVLGLMADDRAERRMHERRIGPKAGLDVVGGPLVVAFLADERADERDAVHLLGDLRQPVGNLNVLGRRLDRLGRLRARSSCPGCGSNVSSWLGPPSIQSTISALGRRAPRRFLRRPRQPLGQRRQPARCPTGRPP